MWQIKITDCTKKKDLKLIETKIENSKDEKLNNSTGMYLGRVK